MNTENQHQPSIRSERRIGWIWAIPALAALLGLWMVKHHFDELGDLIEVSLPSAEGLAEGKTEVRCRAVTIGTLESIRLTDDLEVELDLRIQSDYTHLVRSDSQFWVVKARISGGSVSGLGTLLSGAYIELDPGKGPRGKTQFEGFDIPPPTPNSVPGLRLELVSSEPGSVDVGSNVYFKNTLVGKVETRAFDPEKQEVRFGLFIQDSYRKLVGTNSSFWESSGLDVSVGPEGVDIDLPSLDSLLKGRVEFGTVEGEVRGEEVTNGFSYYLFSDKEKAEANAFESEGEFILLFEQSIRGLREGASVEFRGLKVGRVTHISYNLISEADDSKTPVLIELSRSLLAKHFPPQLLDEGGKGIEQALHEGLRASLKSNNLLTGQRYVDMDYYPEEGPSSLTVIDDYLVLPTVETGLGQMEERVTELLDKLSKLPLESLVSQLEETAAETKKTVKTLNKSLVNVAPLVTQSTETMAEMKASLESLTRLLSSDSTQSIPTDVRETLAQINASLKPLAEDGAVYGDMRRTLDEVRSATRSIERLSETLADKPNSLFFGKRSSSRRVPKAKR